MLNTGEDGIERLKSFVERIERLEDEKRALTEDIREIYSEAKLAGFDIKVLRHVVKLKKMDSHDRAAMEELLEIYKSALDM
tara:strand:+ start:1019 stop:1261 length:243 start_codon:yes stop_codon:yes gene_type:complete